MLNDSAIGRLASLKFLQLSRFQFTQILQNNVYIPTNCDKLQYCKALVHCTSPCSTSAFLDCVDLDFSPHMTNISYKYCTGLRWIYSPCCPTPCCITAYCASPFLTYSYWTTSYCTPPFCTSKFITPYCTTQYCTTLNCKNPYCTTSYRICTTLICTNPYFTTTSCFFLKTTLIHIALLHITLPNTERLKYSLWLDSPFDSRLGSCFYSHFDCCSDSRIESNFDALFTPVLTPIFTHVFTLVVLLVLSPVWISVCTPI